jgi:hypothetical protein
MVVDDDPAADRVLAALELEHDLDRFWPVHGVERCG